MPFGSFAPQHISTGSGKCVYNSCHWHFCFVFKCPRCERRKSRLICVLQNNVNFSKFSWIFVKNFNFLEKSQFSWFCLIFFKFSYNFNTENIFSPELMLNFSRINDYFSRTRSQFISTHQRMMWINEPNAKHTRTNGKKLVLIWVDWSIQRTPKHKKKSFNQNL